MHAIEEGRDPISHPPFFFPTGSAKGFKSELNTKGAEAPADFQLGCSAFLETQVPIP
jgi:hypothetical protein